MKIYNRVVIDIHGRTIEEDSYEYNGPIAHCGGGGSSGEVVFPTYQQDMHTAWLALMDTIIDAEIASNSPYSGLSPYNPDTKLAAIDTQVAALGTLISAIDAPANWQTAVDTVIEKLRVAMPDSETVSTAVDVHDARLAPAHMRSIARLANMYCDMNAGNSSAFFVAMAVLEADHKQKLVEFQSQLELQHEGAKLQMIMTGIQLILGNRHDKARIVLDQSRLVTDVNAKSIIAKIDEKNTGVEWSVKDRRWDTETILFGGNLLGALQGGTMVPDRPSAGQSALSGALSGASIGASFGPVGAGVGAVVGGLASALF